MAEKLAPVRSVLNICGDQTISLNEAIVILERHSGKKLLRVDAPGRHGDQLETSGENLRAKELLGWSAKVGIEEGLRIQLEADWS